jgi:hypothetical protein
MPRKVIGGNAEPVFVISAADLVSNGGKYKLDSKTAVPVHGIVSGERPTTGGVAVAVYPVSQADIDSGDYKLDGGAAIPVISSATYLPAKKSASTKNAIPVYVVSGAAL